VTGPPDHPPSGLPARLTVITGPSGVGKGSVVAEVRRRYPDVWLSVSATTRAPRPGEIDGVHYRFLTPERFAAARDGGEFLEHARFAGNLYGTPRAPVYDTLAAGRPVLLEIDLQGARQIRRLEPSALLVLLAPPSLAELKLRLTGRGTEDPESLRRRLELAERELASADVVDATVVNDDIASAADRLVTLMASA
jgi:guanylate kinase